MSRTCHVNVNVHVNLLIHMQEIHKLEMYSICTTAESLALSIFIICVDDEAYRIYTLGTFRACWSSTRSQFVHYFIECGGCLQLPFSKYNLTLLDIIYYSTLETSKHLILFYQ